MDNPFVGTADEYERNIHLEKAAVMQIAKYTSLQLRIPYEDALKAVLDEMKADPQYSLKDPPMIRVDRIKVGHREQRDSSFLEYLHDIRKSGRIVSPSMTVYEHPDVEKSVTGDWLDANIAGRKKSKGRMFVLNQQGDTLGAQLADYDQNAKKIRINSVSGMRGFKGCSLFLETGHSSLTSMCRAAAGYGNGTVERLLGGCRHYHTPEIVKANIASVLTIEKDDIFTEVIEKYNIKYPSTEDVMDMIILSSSPYWFNDKAGSKEMDIIRNAVSGMTPLERAIYLYTGDMYHLAILNDSLVRTFVTDMIAINYDKDEPVIPEEILDTMKSTDRAYINSLCCDIMMGKTSDDLKANRAEYETVARVALAVGRATARYSDLIKTFLVPRHLPPTVASMKDIMRRRCLIADTDSSIFTTQWWVKWYSGNLNRGEIQDKIWYMSTYVVCQCIAHSMAQLSANVGVAKEMRLRLAMKNEWGFPVIGVAPIAKHYFSYMSIQEGNVFSTYKNELKGVGLRGSTTPKIILDAVQNLINDVLDTVDASKQISGYDLIRRIADYEMSIYRSIVGGDYTYLRSGSIKEDSKNMAYFELWQEVFGPKYGMSEPPPLPTVIISTELENKTSLNEWIAGIEDRELAARLKAWCTKYARDKLPSLPLPYQAIKKTGLPVEIQSAANLRKLVYSVCSGFYMILETCGLHIVDRNYHRLCYDYLDLDPMTAPIFHKLD